MNTNLGVVKAVTAAVDDPCFECGDDYWRSYAADPLPLYQSRITQDARELRRLGLWIVFLTCGGV